MDTARIPSSSTSRRISSATCWPGARPALQVNVDATATVQAGHRLGLYAADSHRRVAEFLTAIEAIRRRPPSSSRSALLQSQCRTAWFTSVMGIINNVTMLAIVLAGAAVVREREHGTMDHLLVMPLTPFEIAMAKIWANGLVIAVAVGLSLIFVVGRCSRIPIVGSVPLFLCGAALYLFFATAVGIFLGTIARSMPQLGLLYILVALPMNMLSGSNTPLESMPPVLRTVDAGSPSTHFVTFAQAILYRGAGFDVVWPQFLAVAGSAGLFLGLALLALPQRVVDAIRREACWPESLLKFEADISIGKARMPLYSFHCAECDKDSELLLGFSDVAVCPACGSEKMERLASRVAPGFQAQGQGQDLARPGRARRAI